jgi:hypothetical protein
MIQFQARPFDCLSFPIEGKKKKKKRKKKEKVDDSVTKERKTKRDPLNIAEIIETTTTGGAARALSIHVGITAIHASNEN